VPPAAQENVNETPEFKVFAGNLAYSTTDEGLKAFFAPVQSDILSAQVIMRGHHSAGYGFVALSSAEATEKAVELLNKVELDGRQVIVEIAKPSDQKNKDRERRPKRRPGRRGGKAVPGEVTEAEANGEVPKTDDLAAPAESDPRKFRRRRRKFVRKPRAAKAEEEAVPPASAPEAQGEAEGTSAPKKAPRARKPPRASRPLRPAGEDPVGEPSKTVLFVANLGFNVDDAGLSAIFTDASINVVSARIVRRRWGRPRKSKGYGFVDVGSEEEQKKQLSSSKVKRLTNVPSLSRSLSTPNRKKIITMMLTRNPKLRPLVPLLLLRPNCLSYDNIVTMFLKVQFPAKYAVSVSYITLCSRYKVVLAWCLFV